MNKADLVKADLVKAVAERSGQTQEVSKGVMDAYHDVITEVLAKGENLPLQGLGTFKVSHRKERMGRNPQTGEAVKIAARNAVTFSAFKALKDAIN